MQSSYRIYKNHQLECQKEACPIPVSTEPTLLKQHTSAGQAESLIRQAKQRADELLRLAEKDSREIVSRAMREAEKAVEAEKQKGFETGYKNGAEEGYREGRDIGWKEGLEESGKIIDQAKEVLKASHVESRQYIESTEKEIVDLSVNIAGTIIQKELELDDNIIMGIAKAALAEVRNRGQIIIRAGKQEAMKIQSRLEELQELCPNDIFTILKDATVSAGGCLIETDVHIIDATVDRQLENIKKVLLEAGRAHEE